MNAWTFAAHIEDEDLKRIAPSAIISLELKTSEIEAVVAAGVCIPDQGSILVRVPLSSRDCGNSPRRTAVRAMDSAPCEAFRSLHYDDANLSSRIPKHVLRRGEERSAARMDPGGGCRIEAQSHRGLCKAANGSYGQAGPLHHDHPGFRLRCMKGGDREIADDLSRRSIFWKQLSLCEPSTSPREHPESIPKSPSHPPRRPPPHRRKPRSTSLTRRRRHRDVRRRPHLLRHSPPSQPPSPPRSFLPRASPSGPLPPRRRSRVEIVRVGRRLRCGGSLRPTLPNDVLVRVVVQQIVRWLRATERLNSGVGRARRREVAR